MKKFLVCLLILGLTFTGFAGIAQAADTGAFNITVTCAFLSIVLRTWDDGGPYSAWDIGTTNLDTTSSMVSAEGIMVKNTSNVATDLSAYVSAKTTWDPAAATGEDKFLLELEDFDLVQADPITFTGNIVSIVDETPDGNDIKSNLADNDDEWVYGRFTTPTVDNSSGTAQTIEVTLKVRAH